MPRFLSPFVLGFFVWVFVLISSVLCPPLPCRVINGRHVVYDYLCKTGSSFEKLIPSDTFFTRVSYMPFVVTPTYSSESQKAPLAAVDFVNLYDFDHPCNYYSTFGCENTTMCDFMELIVLSPGYFLCLKVSRLLELHVSYNRGTPGYFVKDVSSNHSFTLPDFPSKMFILNSSNCKFDFLNGTMSVDCNNIGLHKYYGQLNYFYLQRRPIKYSCGYGFGFYDNVNVFPSISTCIFTYTINNVHVCAASTSTLFCGNILEPILYSSPFSIQPMVLDHPMSGPDICKITDYRLFGIHQNFLNELMGNIDLAKKVIHEFGQQFLWSPLQHFVDFTQGFRNISQLKLSCTCPQCPASSCPVVNCPVLKIDRCPSPVIKNDFSKFPRTLPVLNNCSCPSIDLSRCPTFKCPDLRTDFSNFPRFPVLQPVLNNCSCTNVTCPSLITDFSKFPKFPVPILQPVLNNCSCPQFPTNFTVKPDMDEFLELSARVLHQFVGFLISGEEGHLLRVFNSTLSSRVSRSLGSWLANAIFSLCRPFLDFFLQATSEILLAIVTTLLNFEPYLEKFIETLEQKLEVIVRLFLKIFILFGNIFSKFLYSLDSEINLFEFVVFFFLVYYFSRDSIVSCFSLFVFIFFFGFSRHYQSVFIAYEDHFKNFSIILHHLVSGTPLNFSQFLTLPYNYSLNFNLSFSHFDLNLPDDYFLKLNPNYVGFLRRVRA